MKIGTIQSLACVGLGAMLGFSPRREASLRLRGPTRAPRPVRQVAAETRSTDPGVSRTTCGPEGPARNVLLAQADAKNDSGPGPNRPLPGRSRTSSSSWATTSAGSTSAPITGA